MHLRFESFNWCMVFAGVLAFGLAGCRGSGSEPSEAQLKDAMEFAMNNAPGITNVAPITIAFFKKETCDALVPQGFRCTFTVMVTSANIGASMYNSLTTGEFYKDKDSGKWVMQPPF